MSGHAIFYAMLGLFIFGAVTSGVNSLGLFTLTIPSTQMQLGTQTVTDLSNSATSQQPTDFNIWALIINFGKMLWGGATAVIASPFMIHDWMTFAGADSGMSWIISGIIGAPLSLIMIISFLDWILGRNST